MERCDGMGSTMARAHTDSEEKPFVTVSQQTFLLQTEHWDGHEIRVILEVEGKLREGYGVAIDPAAALDLANADALQRKNVVLGEM